MLDQFPICSIIPYSPLSRCIFPRSVLCRRGASGRISDLHSRKGETIRELMLVTLKLGEDCDTGLMIRERTRNLLCDAIENFPSFMRRLTLHVS